MGNQGHFLVNTVVPALVQTSGTFDVSNRAMRVTASGLEGDDTIAIEVWVGPDPLKGDGAWEPLFQAGTAVQLSATDTQRTIILIGQYRAVYSGVATVRCYAQEDSLELDGNIVYAFNQPYIAGGGGGGGFTLTAGDTNSVDMHFSGTSSSGTVSADAKISADAGNQVSIHSDGLFVPAGAAGGFTLTGTDTPTVDLTVTGNTSAGTLTAAVKISATGGNIISAEADGIFATAGGAAFNMPFTLESGDFAVGTTYSAYAVQDPDTGTVVATLPDSATAGGQIYILAQEYDTSSGDHTGLTVNPTGSDKINGESSIHIEPGQTALFYAAGADNTWLMANYTQISTAAGNLITWVPPDFGVGGLFLDTVPGDQLTGDVVASPVGSGLVVTEGSNAKMGIVTLTAGTAVVSTTAVTANSRIFLTAQTLGTVVLGQGLAVSARTPGTSFTITSGSATDTSTVAWMIVEPA